MRLSTRLATLVALASISSLAVLATGLVIGDGNGARLLRGPPALKTPGSARVALDRRAAGIA